MAGHAAVQVGAEPFRAAGDGDRATTAVVLVHGFTGNPRATRPMAQVLNEAGFSVDAIRLPGHGTTPRDMGTTRWADWRTAVTHAVDRALREHDRVVLVGHSMGGTLALDLAGSRDDVAGCVAINAIIEEPPSPLARLAPVLQYIVPMLPREAVGLPRDDIARPDVSEDAYLRVPSKSAHSLMQALPAVRASLATLSAPLLIISSRVDNTVATVNGDLIEREAASDDVRRIFLDRSWHVPQLDWDREEVEQAVLAFVDHVHAAAGQEGA